MEHTAPALCVCQPPAHTHPDGLYLGQGAMTLLPAMQLASEGVRWAPTLGIASIAACTIESGVLFILFFMLRQQTR